jgi:hypothetical protein
MARAAKGERAAEEEETPLARWQQGATADCEANNLCDERQYEGKQSELLSAENEAKPRAQVNEVVCSLV